ncbi:MAG: hypothetical protein ACRDHV_04605 [Actinomycetota bacterium]
MSTQEEEVRRRPKGRSPNYPGINLETAIERARRLYAEERGNWAHFDTIVRHWNYQPKSGGARVTFAALKKFGLLTDDGSGARKRGRLTDLALSILQDTRPDSAEREEAIREAALMPPIHRELWEEYGGTLPSDDNLRYSLVRQRGFTESGAAEFVQEFRATIAFARLGESSRMPSDDGGDGPTKKDPVTPTGPGTLTPPPATLPEGYKVPLGAGRAALLQLPSPFTERDWDLMLRVLEAMKPGLIEAEPPPTPAPAGPEKPETEPHEDE